MNNIGRCHRECEHSQGVRRGRPRKDPEIVKREREQYRQDQEKKIQELLEEAVTIFAVPFDDRDERPMDAPTISSVAKAMNTSRMRVRKLLITANYYSSNISRRIAELQKAGYSIEEICREMKMGRAAVHSYLPYQKVIYKMAEPSLNAKQCLQFQLRRKTVEQLQEHLDVESLWDAIKAFSQYKFRSVDGQTCSYKIDGEMVCFGSITLSRREIECAFRQARRIQNECGCVKSLSGKGAEELYTVFLRIGACRKSDQFT